MRTTQVWAREATCGGILALRFVIPDLSGSKHGLRQTTLVDFFWQLLRVPHSAILHRFLLFHSNFGVTNRLSFEFLLCNFIVQISSGSETEFGVLKVGDSTPLASKFGKVVQQKLFKMASPSNPAQFWACATTLNLSLGHRLAMI